VNDEMVKALTDLLIALGELEAALADIRSCVTRVEKILLIGGKDGD